MVDMKILIPLQAASSVQAQRENLKVYAQIEMMEQGKVGTRSDYTRRGVDWEKRQAITRLYPTESDAIVPLKPWKHGGGMGISQP